MVICFHSISFCLPWLPLFGSLTSATCRMHWCAPYHGKKMCPEAIPMLESVFLGLIWILSFLLRKTISALDEARAEVMLARVIRYAAVEVAKLARAVAISCWNDLFFTHLFFTGYIGAVVPRGLCGQLRFTQVLVCSGIIGLGNFPGFISR